MPPSVATTLLVFVVALVTTAVEEVSACVSFTTTVDDAGDPGSGACLPYNVEIVATAGTVLLPEASESATALAPAMDVSVLVDESGSLLLLCAGNSNQCYLNEKDFAQELITLLDDSVDIFSKGGTAQYIEYSAAVNVNQAFTNKADYLACKCTRYDSTRRGTPVSTCTATVARRCSFNYR